MHANAALRTNATNFSSFANSRVEAEHAATSDEAGRDALAAFLRNLDSAKERYATEEQRLAKQKQWILKASDEQVRINRSLRALTAREAELAAQITRAERNLAAKRADLAKDAASADAIMQPRRDIEARTSITADNSRRCAVALVEQMMHLEQTLTTTACPPDTAPGMADLAAKRAELAEVISRLENLPAEHVRRARQRVNGQAEDPLPCVDATVVTNTSAMLVQPDDAEGEEAFRQAQATRESLKVQLAEATATMNAAAATRDEQRSELEARLLDLQRQVMEDGEEEDAPAQQQQDE